jgi:hypothetical protein
MLAALQKASLTVGVHEAEGSAENALEGGTVIDKANGAEFGIGQPPRQPIGGWFDSNEPQLAEDLKKIATAAVKQHRPVEQALARFGVHCVGQIQQRIADGIDPPLSPARLAEKEALTGSPKETPLILTGQFRSSIRSKVERG